MLPPLPLHYPADLFGADGDEGGSNNVCVNNLHPEVTEDMLMREFGRFGPLASVKVGSAVRCKEGAVQLVSMLQQST